MTARFMFGIIGQLGGLRQGRQRRGHCGQGRLRASVFL